VVIGAYIVYITTVARRIHSVLQLVFRKAVKRSPLFNLIPVVYFIYPCGNSSHFGKMPDFSMNSKGRCEIDAESEEN